MTEAEIRAIVREEIATAAAADREAARRSFTCSLTRNPHRTRPIRREGELAPSELADPQ